MSVWKASLASAGPVLRTASISRLARLSVALTLSAASLYLALRQVDFQAVGQALLEAQWRLVAVALGCALVNNGLKIIRWRVFLRSPADRRGWLRIGRAFLAAQFLNAWFPVRLGEVSRVYALGAGGGGYAFTAGTLALEKVLDMGAYALLLVLLVLRVRLPDWLGRPALTFAWLAAGLVGLLVLVVYRRAALLNWFERNSRRLPAALQVLTRPALAAGLSSLDVLTSGRELAGLLALTGMIWLTALVTNQLVLWALGLWLPWTAALLLLLALQAGISLPALPGKVGVFEFVCILSLAVFGIERVQALSYGILLHVVVYLPVLVGGLASLTPLSVNLDDQHV